MSQACTPFRGQLEAYLDGELSARRRSLVDRHLQECADCRQELANLKLHGQVLREDLLAAADRADLGTLEDRVLARIAQEGRAARLPLGERLAVWCREFLYHHRAVWITSLATAAVLVAVLVPLLSASPPVITDQPRQIASVDNEVIIDKLEYSGERSMIFTVSKNNTTVIWLYDMNQVGHKTQGDDL
jgi:anti-sigma factor RsiW